MANRFWVTQPVTGAIVSAASPPQVRLTVSSTTGMTTGDVRTVAGIVGTTEANGTWTITVIDATHIDLQGTTFANLYTSGGSVNGKWDATNTNNWVSSTGGTNYGQTIPGSGDTATLDGSSGGGTVTVNATITVQSITCGAFTGTLDFSANNNNVTLNATGGFSGSGSGARTINLGNGTWTLSASNTQWLMTTTTNLTFNANSSTITLTGAATTINTFAGGGLSYSTLNLNGANAVAVTGANTIATLSVTSGTATIYWPSGTINTITNAFTLTGSASAPISFISSSSSTAATVTTGSATTNAMTWGAFRGITFTPVGGSTLTATSGLNLGQNSGTGFTINAPTSGAVGVIGG